MRQFKDQKEWFDTMTIHTKFNKHTGVGICSTCGMPLKDRNDSGGLFSHWGGNYQWNDRVKRGKITPEVAKHIFQLLLPKHNMVDASGDIQEMSEWVAMKMAQLCDTDFLIQQCKRLRDPLLSFYTCKYKLNVADKDLKDIVDTYTVKHRKTNKPLRGGREQSPRPLLAFYKHFNLVPPKAVISYLSKLDWDDEGDQLFFWNQVMKQLGPYDKGALKNLCYRYTRHLIPAAISHINQYAPGTKVLEHSFSDRMKTMDYVLSMTALHPITGDTPELEKAVRKSSSAYPIYLKYFKLRDLTNLPTPEEKQRCVRSGDGEMLYNILFNPDDAVRLNNLTKAGSIVTTMRYKIMVLTYAAPTMQILGSMLTGRPITNGVHIELNEEEGLI